MRNVKKQDCINIRNIKKMKKLYIILAILVSFSSRAQDPEFTQFYANPIYLNPAMAGTHGCPRLNLNHRNQWPSLSGAFYYKQCFL